jgi:hypothetical protein
MNFQKRAAAAALSNKVGAPNLLAARKSGASGIPC